MDALILSCSTGGGHNAAAAAIKEALTLRGHHAVMLDPYELAGKNLDRKVGNTYIKIAQRTPRLHRQQRNAGQNADLSAGTLL